MNSRLRLMAPMGPGILDQFETEAKSGVVETERSMGCPAPPSAGMREVLGFKQCWLADLPLAWSLLVSRAHEGGLLLLTTSRVARHAALEAQVPAFVGREVSALALAAEHDRASPVALAAWCALKLREPEWRLTTVLALDLDEQPAHLGWTVEQVLRAYGATLQAVGTGDEVLW